MTPRRPRPAPALADHRRQEFLITIGDRTVGGMVSPRSDGGPVASAGERCAVTISDYVSVTGDAMSDG